MSISSVIKPFEASPDHGGRLVAQADPAVVEVLFPLVDDEDWPPCPAETIDAVLIAHDLAEIAGIPWFVTNISRGDIVKVRCDGIGYVGGSLVSGGGHCTIHVMATTHTELAPLVRGLQSLGATVLSGLNPPMLAVDVPENVAMGAIVNLLADGESLTCAFTIACCQQRVQVRR